MFPKKPNDSHGVIVSTATMFSKTKFVIMVALFLSALSCTAFAPPVHDMQRASKINHIMESWVGHYQSELIASWGPPTSIEPDAQGGATIIYESLKGTWGDKKDKHIVGGAQYPAGPGQPGYAAKRVFHVNEKGIICSWEWSGL